MKFLDYIKGVRRGKEANRIEQDAMSDPFLAEAIEGYDSVKGDHADRIARMQARVIQKTTQKQRSGIWRVAVAAIALIAVISGYFALMNHESSMAVAGCENCFIAIYVPDDYIQKKRLELTVMQEDNPNEPIAMSAVVDIENLNEVISPVERLTVYLPDTYAQVNEKGDKDIPVDVYVEAEPSNEVYSATSTISSNEHISQSQARMVRSIAEDSFESDVTADLPVATAPAPTSSDYLSMSGSMAKNSDNVTNNHTEKEKSSLSSSSINMKKSKAGNISKSIIGENQYEVYLQQNITHPTEGDCATVKGVVKIEFSVSENGRPHTIIVVESLCDDLDQEVIRLIQSRTDWTPVDKVRVQVKF